MPPTQQPGSTASDNNKAILSVGVIGVIVAIIAIAVWSAHRIRPPIVVPLSVRNQRMREEELQRKEMDHFILESIPAIRYTAQIPLSEQTVSGAHDPAANTTQRGEKSTTDGKNAPTRKAGSTLMAKEMVNNVKTFDNKTLDDEGSPNADTSRSKEESASCSVCREDFVENDTVRILPCDHMYHQSCIDPWVLGSRKTCPLW